MIKGIIFDMDGVIVDNHKYHFKAWMAFAEKHNFKLDAHIYRDKFNGKTNADLFKLIFGKETPNSKIKEYTNEKESMYRKLYENDMRAHTGLVDFLDILKSKRLKIALGTSAPTENVDFILDNLRLRAYFEAIVDGSEVERGKPDPQVYEMCMFRMGLDPSTCVVFEDSLAGLDSANRARCRTVGVATSHTAAELRPKADHIIHDFTEAKRILWP